MRDELERLSLLQNLTGDDDTRLYRIASHECEPLDCWVSTVSTIAKLAIVECCPLGPNGVQEVHTTGWLYLNGSARWLGVARSVFDRLPQKGRMTDAAINQWQRLVDRLGERLKRLAEFKFENRKKRVC
jgi:hypothetical protein